MNHRSKGRPTKMGGFLMSPHELKPKHHISYLDKMKENLDIRSRNITPAVKSKNMTPALLKEAFAPMSITTMSFSQEKR